MSNITSRPKASAVLSDAGLKGVLHPDFMYGCATAAYQVEGAWNEDGKLPNVWDVHLKNTDNGEVACDSYHLWKEDIELVKKYGCNTYRFSIAWSRVRPLGGRNDPWNEAGLKYYDDLINALLAAGITPFVTIFHWDHPQSLEERYGGFYNAEEIVEDFVSYAEGLFERYGDRVKHWITINEPHIFTMMSSMGYKLKEWVHKRDHARFAKSILLCHARTFDLYKQRFQPSQQGTIGIVYNCDWVEGVDDSAEGRETSQWVLDWVLGFYAEPVFHGRFPDRVTAYLGEHTPQFTDAEWALLKGSTEFFGWNHYGTQLLSGKRLETDNGRLVSFGSAERVFERDGKQIGNKGHGGHPYDVPWGFRKLMKYITERFTGPAGIPIMITECGFTPENEAEWSLEETINDTQRQDYYSGYMKEMFEAVRDDGIDIRGFMVWSLLDNLEWLQGYAKRFGVTAVDWENGCKRYPKDSSALVKALFAHGMGK